MCCKVLSWKQQAPSLLSQLTHEIGKQWDVGVQLFLGMDANYSWLSCWSGVWSFYEDSVGISLLIFELRWHWVGTVTKQLSVCLYGHTSFSPPSSFWLALYSISPYWFLHWGCCEKNVTLACFVIDNCSGEFQCPGVRNYYSRAGMFARVIWLCNHVWHDLLCFPPSPLNVPSWGFRKAMPLAVLLVTWTWVERCYWMHFWH